MSTAQILDEIFTPFGDCVTPEMAGRILALRLPVHVQEKLDDFADRNTEGKLSAEERAEYESYLHAIHFVGILQARARDIVNQQNT